jgi:hypothetical protein
MLRKLSSADKKHLAECALDPYKVGEWCGAGAGHDVYEYGESHVVKVPKIRWLKDRLSIITAQDASSSLEIIEEHFREFSIPASIHKSDKNTSYCIVQKRLFLFENLTSAHLRMNITLAKQLSEVMRRNRKLVKDHKLSLDFLGKQGCIQSALSSISFGTPQMSNLVVVGYGASAHIVIVDSNVFSISRACETLLQRKLMNDAGKCGHVLNEFIVKRTFGSASAHTKA